MLHLSPDNSHEFDSLPEENKGTARAAETVTELSAPLSLPPGEITVIRVHTGFFTVNAAVNTMVKGDRLFVTFHGARKGGKNAGEAGTPMFMRRDWHTLYPGPILALSDPQTERAWASTVPRSAMYMGTFKHDLVPELNALIDKVCDSLGISRDNVVMYGPSSGGNAAILTGTRRKTRTGIIAVCPPLRPNSYRNQLLTAAASAIGGTVEEWKALMADEPRRAKPIEAIRESLKEGNDVKVVVAQCLQDAWTMNQHYPALWHRFDMDADGGVDASGRVMTALYDTEEGHGSEPPEFARPLLKLALDFFDAAPPSDAAKNPAAAKKAKKKEKADAFED